MGKQNLNLYQKLVEVRKQFQYISKDAKGYNFQYVPGSYILSLLRPAMDELGIILKYDVEEVINEEVEKSQKQKVGTINLKTTRVKLKFNFRFINADNPQEVDETVMWTQIIGDDIQQMGAAQTYTLRYFLLGFFNIPNDKDDPDTHKAKTNIFKTQEKIAQDQVDEIMKLIDGQKEIKNKLLVKFNNDLSNIPASMFDTIKDYIIKETSK